MSEEATSRCFASSTVSFFDFGFFGRVTSSVSDVSESATFGRFEASLVSGSISDFRFGAANKSFLTLKVAFRGLFSSGVGALAGEMLALEGEHGTG